MALAGLVVQNTLLVIVLKLTYRTGAAAYASSTVVLVTEIIKFVISSLVTARKSSRHLAIVVTQIYDQPLLFVPSLLYVIQNNLLFYGAKRLSPVVYVVCTQMKILTTAFMSVVILRTQLTSEQYSLLVLLTIGVIIVQGQGKSGMSRSTSNDTENSTIGVLAVLLACLTSGTAGVLLEKIFKSRTTGRQTAFSHTVWARNVQLSLISIPFAVLGVLGQDASILFPGNVFRGYDEFVWGVVALQAIGGLLIAYIMKFSNNILKCLAIAISICCCAVYSIATEELVLTPSLAAGVLLVCFAVWAFSLSTSKTPTDAQQGESLTDKQCPGDASLLRK